jgi:hypothetical protein
MEEMVTSCCINAHFVKNSTAQLRLLHSICSQKRKKLEVVRALKIGRKLMEKQLKR